MNDHVESLHQQLDQLQSKFGGAAQEVVHLRATLARVKAALVTEQDVTLRLQSKLSSCQNLLKRCHELAEMGHGTSQFTHARAALWEILRASAGVGQDEPSVVERLVSPLDEHPKVGWRNDQETKS